MKQKKENRVALLLHWAGEQKIWLFLAIFLSAVSGLCILLLPGLSGCAAWTPNF